MYYIPYNKPSDTVLYTVQTMTQRHCIIYIINNNPATLYYIPYKQPSDTVLYTL